MALGATSYTTVTWTQGDIATETKMDNMVANDQAYDSHAGQGLLLNNTYGLYGKDTGGTNRALMMLDSDDIGKIGDANLTNMQFLAPFKSSVQPHVSLTNSSAQTISNSSATRVTAWDTETIDVGGLHDTGTDPSRITIPTGQEGLYLVGGTMWWASNSTGRRIMYFYKNGSDAEIGGYAYSPSVAGDNRRSSTAIFSLSAGDYVEMFVFQDSGGNLDLEATNNYFWAVKLF